MKIAECETIKVTLCLPRIFVETAVLAAIGSTRDRSSCRLALAKWVLANRRKRSKIFGCIRLGEPSWDMILDLYIADLEIRRVDVSGLCLASGVAPTTALRYVDLLVADQFITKVEDRDDGRRTFVTMSVALRTAVDQWLDQSEASLRVAGWIGTADPTPDNEADADRSR